MHHIFKLTSNLRILDLPLDTLPHNMFVSVNDTAAVYGKMGHSMFYNYVPPFYMAYFVTKG